MPINELRSIATFVRTAELGSLRKAAAAQGMTPQAASQALAQLEQHLGVRLLHRGVGALDHLGDALDVAGDVVACLALLARRVGHLAGLRQRRPRPFVDVAQRLGSLLGPVDAD